MLLVGSRVGAHTELRPDVTATAAAATDSKGAQIAAIVRAELMLIVSTRPTVRAQERSCVCVCVRHAQGGLVIQSLSFDGSDDSEKGD